MSDNEDAHPTSAPPLQETVPDQAVGSVPAPRFRTIMQITDKRDWQHYYTMPAQVGMQVVPGLLREMHLEGVPVQEVEITFEVREVK